MDRVILHSDMNNCYASIELLHHSGLWAYHLFKNKAPGIIRINEDPDSGESEGRDEHF